MASLTKWLETGHGRKLTWPRRTLGNIREGAKVQQCQTHSPRKPRPQCHYGNSQSNMKNGTDANMR
eukprot:1326643-Amphidinium_carterae.1